MRTTLRTTSRTTLLLAVLVTVVAGGAAHGAPAPTLDELVAAGRRHALSTIEQTHVVTEAEAARDVATGALWPSLSATAGYTHNQYEVVVSIPRGTDAPLDATITPSDQLDATVQLTVPLLDLGSRRQIRAAEANVTASRAAQRATAVDVDRAVVRAYYQWLGGQALVQAARASEAAADSTLALTERRASAGLAVELDTARARAQRAHAQKAIADARLVVAGAVRQLSTLTGIRPDGDGPPLPEDVRPEAAVESFLSVTAQLPELATARAEREAALARAAVERAAYLPVVSAFARERLSNAAGFGDAFNWAAGVQLSWTLDRRIPARVAQTRAASAVSAVRLARVEQDARDRVIDAWDQVEALRAGAIAATAQVEAARLATTIAQNRNAEGTATLQQVIDAQADQLEGEVSLVRARADLAAARALLRIASGRGHRP